MEMAIYAFSAIHYGFHLPFLWMMSRKHAELITFGHHMDDQLAEAGSSNWTGTEVVLSHFRSD
jgi:hypothetical protein